VKLAQGRNAAQTVSARIICLVVAAILLVTLNLGSALAVDGEAVVTGKCTACHSTDRIKTKQLSTGEWATLVDREIQRGAQLSTDERNAAIAYLSTNYGVSPAASLTTDTPAQQAETSATPAQQAYTGVEMWQFVLLGGSLLGSGVWLRRRQ